MTEPTCTAVLPLPRHRALGQRLVPMTLLWSGFGVVTGVLTTPSGGTIGLVSGILAGLTVLCPMGAFLGLLGGRVRPSLLGGLVGAGLAALAAQLLHLAAAGHVCGLGLVSGGLVGATSSALFFGILFLLRLGSTPGQKRWAPFPTRPDPHAQAKPVAPDWPGDGAASRATRESSPGLIRP